MKLSLPLTALFTALIIFCAISPGVAKADQTYDCTTGCWVVTCDGANCTLWRCDSTGCRAVSVFNKNEEKARPNRLESLIAPEVAYAKVCPAKKSCSLFELRNGQAIDLGSFDNLDAIIQSREEDLKLERN